MTLEFIPSWNNPKELTATYDKYFRDKKAKRFYNSRWWRQCRRFKLLCNPLCTCGQLATEVHHLQPIAKRPDLALDIDNLESVCHRCHLQKRKEASEDTEKFLDINELNTL